MKDNCVLRKKCRFALSKEELLCTACDIKGHGRDECLLASGSFDQVSMSEEPVFSTS